MKVMLVIGALSFGGAERVMANLANYLSEQNDVLLCTLFNRENPYKISKKVIIKQGLAAKGKIFSFKELRKTAKKYKPDIVLSFLTQINIMTIVSLWGTGIPVVVSERNDPNFEPKQRIRKILRKIIFPFASGYVFQTTDAMNYFSTKIKKKGIVIPNPVFIPEEIEAVSFFKRKKEFVAVGRLTAQKNYPILIDAFSKVVKKHPDFSLKIYGDGELKEVLLKDIEKKNLQNNIFLMGTSKTIHKDIVESYGFIMSSDHEGMPNVLLEAMSLGLCCISTDCPCGGPKELINNKQNGLLVPVRDVNALADAICMSIEDFALAEHLSLNAQSARNRYNIERIGEKWEGYLRKISNISNL